MNDAIFDQPFDVRAFVEVDKVTLSITAILYDVVNSEEIASFSQSIGGNEDEGFPEVLAKFKEFCGFYPVWVFDKDQEILEKICTSFSVPFPFCMSFIRVKSLLRSWKVNPRGYSSGTLYKAAGLKMDGGVDETLHNVRSMAAAVSYFEDHEAFSRPSA